MKKHTLFTLALACTLCPIVGVAGDKGPGEDGPGSGCAGLPSYSQLQTALSKATSDETSGLNMNMWGTIVNRDGVSATGFGHPTCLKNPATSGTPLVASGLPSVE